ncbi:MAG: domain S-box-containing protein [Bacteroidetes bacterium]|nr:domain S-box-containing protein [Bacteroidota bacterium]
MSEDNIKQPDPDERGQKSQKHSENPAFTEEAYHHFFENMLHGFAYCKVLFNEAGKADDFIYLIVNKNYEAMTGLENVAGKKASEAMPGVKESGSAYFEMIGRVVLTGKAERFETYAEVLGKWFSISLYRPEEGYFAGFIDNITERKEAEAKINQLNRLYAFISQVNQTIIHIKDEQLLLRQVCKIALEFGKFKMAWIGRVDSIRKRMLLLEQAGMGPEDLDLFGNAAYKEGGPIEQVLLTGISYISNDIENDPALEAWKHHARDRGIRSLAILPLKKGGEITATFHLYSSIHHFFDSEETTLLEEAAGDVSFAMDIFEKEKERIAIEKKIKEAEKNHKAIFDNASEGFVLLDSNCMIKAFNEKAKEYIFLNADKEVRSGQSIYEFMDESRIAPLKEIMLKVLKGETIQYEHYYGVKNGRISWFSFTMAPVRENEKVTDVCITGRDITEKKLAEQERELDRNNLKKSEAHLKSANRDLETFIYRASHDLRGPLSSIMGLTNVSRLEITDEKALSYIDMISLSTKKLDDTLIGLVQSMALKDVAKFEDEIDFKGMIDETFNKFQFYEGFSRMNFMVDISLSAPFVSSRLILQPVIQNLIENSIKYQDVNAENSYTNISISDTANEVRIVFRDNGIGMEPSIHEKVFDVYYKGTQSSKGSGLGLYIVKTALEKINGSIELKSARGKGSTFTIRLPKQ